VGLYRKSHAAKYGRICNPRATARASIDPIRLRALALSAENKRRHVRYDGPQQPRYNLAVLSIVETWMRSSVFGEWISAASNVLSASVHFVRLRIQDLWSWQWTLAGLACLRNSAAWNRRPVMLRSQI
jgi:hypothetical protein